MLGEINFGSKLHLEASNFFVEKLSFRQKKVEGCGNIWGRRGSEGWGEESFGNRSKTQTPCNIAVINTTQ